MRLADANAYSDGDSNSDGNTDSHVDVNGYSYSNSNSYSHRYADANEHAESNPHTTSASDAATSSVVRSAKLEPLRPGLARETREFSGWGGSACPQDDAKASSPEAQVLGGIAA
jgi:hypothetical protein